MTTLALAMEAVTQALTELKEDSPNVVSVSDALFAEKHMMFDRGARYVYTGRKDGTDRKWIRLRNKLIVLAGNNKQFLVPRTLPFLQDGGIRPLSKFAARVMNDRFDWVYGNPESFTDPVTGEERKNVIGYIHKGKLYTDLDKPFRGKECGHCRAVKTAKELRVCSGCKTFVYCSTDCQKADWPTHKSVCRKIGEGSIK